MVSGTALKNLFINASKICSFVLYPAPQNIDRFIKKARKGADALLTEGTMYGRQDEEVMTEQELEERLIKKIEDFRGPVLFQSSSQNIDRLVSFYRAAKRLNRIFVVDVYTANILHELRQLDNNRLPYPS